MRNILFLLIIAMSAASCQDFFSKKIETDPPPYDKSLVFHHLMSEQDTAVRLVLSRNYGIFDPIRNDSVWYVKGAVAEWWSDGQKQLTLSPLSLDSGFVYTGKLPANLVPGHEYEIRVSHPDFESVRAVQTMPLPLPAIAQPEFKRNISKDEFGAPVHELSFSFQDVADTKNYYEFLVSTDYYYLSFIEFDPSGMPVWDTIPYRYNVYFNSTLDPNMVGGINGTVLLSDQFFDGQNYQFTGRFTPPIYGSGEEDSLKYRMVIRSVSEEYYRWSTSYRKQSDNAGNPFAEPISVYSNLEKGLGIFGLFSERRFDLE